MADAFDEAANAVYNQGGFNASDMTTDAARKLLTATANTIKQGVDSHLPVDVPPTLRYALENNAFIFSGLKTFHALREVGLSMVKDDGSIKSFEEFKDDVKQINSKYNTNYLYAEYKHAVGTSQMAAKWVDIEADGDRYDLQYRTAGDDKVRPDHAALDGITLPPSDPFWSKYYPPNGWGCRCTAVQVRVGKYQRSNPADAMQAGDTATEEAKQKMFRYNSGKTMQLFPPKHPYRKVSPATNAVVQQVSAEQLAQQRIDDMIAEMPAHLTDDEKKALAEHCVKLETALGIRKGRRMTVEEADKQAANPNLGKERGFSINCQTCAPAYVLRIMGFNVWAKSNRAGTKLDYLSRGHAFEVWRNLDGTPATPVGTLQWMQTKGYNRMNQSRYLEYFNEVCKETGIYELSIGWKGNKWNGHATILQRFPNGELRYIEPQNDNSKGSKREYRDIKALAADGTATPTWGRGILRVDNKLFDDTYADIFDR
ncbi:MAG: minor capsid protein [Paludibacteraceae bacterium]|nr:minor capsid protein [Paludibacteraceae bacterium]